MFSVIFDMDGTLLDTQRICIPAWEYAGLNQGIKGVGEAIQHICGMNKAGWSGYLTEHYPTLDIGRFISEMRQYIIDNIQVKFMPGAESLLNWLRENKIKMGLASGSSTESIMHHLTKVSAEGYFDAIVGGEQVKNGKPAPDIFLLTSEKMGVDPKTCFVFEDSPHGIIAAYKAGMKSIGIPDVAIIPKEVDEFMFARLNRLDEAIEIFQKLI